MAGALTHYTLTKPKLITANCFQIEPCEPINYCHLVRLACPQFLALDTPSSWLHHSVFCNPHRIDKWIFFTSTTGAAYGDTEGSITPEARPFLTSSSMVLFISGALRYIGNAIGGISPVSLSCDIPPEVVSLDFDFSGPNDSRTTSENQFFPSKSFFFIILRRLLDRNINRIR